MRGAAAAGSPGGITGLLAVSCPPTFVLVLVLATVFFIALHFIAVILFVVVLFLFLFLFMANVLIVLPPPHNILVLIVVHACIERLIVPVAPVHPPDTLPLSTTAPPLSSTVPRPFFFLIIRSVRVC